MNKATLGLTVLLIAGYIGFEATHVYRFKHRMETGYILDELVVADRAVELCGEVPEAQRERFLHNLGVMRRRALAELEAAGGSEPDAAVEPTLEARLDEKRAEVEAHVAEYGCSDSQVWRWMKLHEVRARLRVVDKAT